MVDFEEGWLDRQISKAKEIIAGWSPVKRSVMLQEPETTAEHGDTHELHP